MVKKVIKEQPLIREFNRGAADPEITVSDLWYYDLSLSFESLPGIGHYSKTNFPWGEEEN